MFWGISPLCFASAGRRIGSYAVALLRLAMATGLLLAILPAYHLVMHVPLAMPSVGQWTWLIVSGIAGMGVGDLLGYEALVTLGPRRATQMNTLAPVASVLVAWVWLDEHLRIVTLLGIALVLGATSYAVLVRSREQTDSREPGRVSGWGLFCGIGSAVLMGLGAVTARKAFRLGDADGGPALDPLVATAIRVGTTAVVLWLGAALRGEVVRLWRKMGDPEVRVRVIAGTILGPTLGMICYISALRYIETGLVSTISSISPLVLLPIVYLRYQARIGWDVVAACVLAVAGVAVIS